jgi:hypothetical protein
VHDALGLHDFPAEGRSYSLMPEADSQYGFAPREAADEFDGHPGRLGPTRARGDDEPIEIESLGLVEAYRIVANHAHFLSLLHE